MNRPLLPGKVAIINGGATGMGRSTALLFSEEGCNCVIADVNAVEGKKTAAEASKRGKECIFVSCDLTDLKQIKDCVDVTVKKFKTVDILVGCAGGSVPRSKVITPTPRETIKRGIQYTDEKYYDLMMALNLKGHVFFAKEVAPYMLKQNSGKMVFISSMGVFNPPGPSVEYHGAKAGHTRFDLQSGLRSSLLIISTSTPFYPVRSRRRSGTRCCPTYRKTRGVMHLTAWGRILRWAGSASRKTSPTVSCSSAPSYPPSSPDRPSMSAVVSHWDATSKADPWFLHPLKRNNHHLNRAITNRVQRGISPAARPGISLLYLTNILDYAVIM